MRCFTVVAALLAGSQLSLAITIDLTSVASIKDAAKTAASNAMKYYTGNKPGQIPGLLPTPYYFWEAGELWGHMVEYFYYTGDSQYNDVVSQALQFQMGPNENFMPPNQTKSEGNDDQASWGLAALSAAELGFPSTPSDKPSWLTLAKNVFEDQVQRWDTATCNGGLRWQIFEFNSGYSYKNSASNGDLFLLASRLALYTGNTTYADWASKVFDWAKATGLITSNFAVYDGTEVTGNCTQTDKLQWTQNVGIFLQGSATMYNYTNGSKTWADNVSGLLSASKVFTSPDTDILLEVACEPSITCNVDQRSFKAILARALGRTVQLAPFTSSLIKPKLASNAQAAAKICTYYGDDTCGFNWGPSSGLDGGKGVGEQMNALAIFNANLVGFVAAPVRGAGAGAGSNGTGTSSGGSRTNGTASATGTGSSASATHNGVGKFVPAVGNSAFAFMAASMLLVL